MSCLNKKKIKKNEENPILFNDVVVDTNKEQMK